MNILDQAIEATTAPSSPLFSGNEGKTESANSLYRGFAKPVTNYSNLQGLLEQTGLNWKVCERPVLVQGKSENRLFEGKKALIRCDNGDMIDITSDTFRVHQNEEIVGAMADSLAAVNATVTKGGYFPDSGRVFLEARLSNNFTVNRPSGGFGHSFQKGAQGAQGKVGDMIALDLFVIGGHKPGTPFKMRGIAKRLVCSNGATVTEMMNMIRLTHKQKMNAIDSSKLRDFHTQVIAAFEEYSEGYKLLNKAEASPAVQQAYLLDVIGEGDLLGKIVKRQSLTGADLIQEIVNRDEQLRTHNADWLLDTIRDLKRKDENLEVPRIHARINEVVNDQPGGHFTHGTIAHMYNATTYYVDHLRGRGGSAAVADAIDGDGDRLKRSAMATGRQWAEVLTARG